VAYHLRAESPLSTSRQSHVRHGVRALTARSPSLNPPVWTNVPSGETDPEEHQTLVWTKRERNLLTATSYSMECAVQSVLTTISFGLLRHLPLGRLRLENPKSVRSSMTTRSLWRSCMCMPTMPMLS